MNNSAVFTSWKLIKYDFFRKVHACEFAGGFQVITRMTPILLA